MAKVTNMESERELHSNHLCRLEGELAAVVRQFLRAANALDLPAREVEAKAVCYLVRSLLFHHLHLRVQRDSDDWFWLSGLEEKGDVQRAGPMELIATGRFACDLADDPRRYLLRLWTEPFSAWISHSVGATNLAAYTIRFGNRSTFVDLSAARKAISSGNALAPSPPLSDDGWAFIFHMGDRD